MIKNQKSMPGTPKVLIVDDKPENLFALESVLADLDLELIKATSGNDALKATLNHSFALAILDVQMPGMDGYELAKLIRSKEKISHMPILFLSAVYSDDFHISKGYESGALDFLLKPYNPVILIEKVKKLLEQYMYKNKLEMLVDELNKANTMLQHEITERKKANQQIGKLYCAIEQSSSMVIITDTQGNIEYVNKVFAQTTGYSIDDAIGKNLRVIKPDDTSQELYKELWNAIISGKDWQKEYCSIKRNGELCWEVATVSPVKNDEGVTTNFIAFKDDITERKQMEEGLIKAQKLESIGTLAGGIAHDFNNSLQAILGYISLAMFHDTSVEEIHKYLDESKNIILQSRNLTKQLLTFSKGGDPVKSTISILELVMDSTKLALSGSNVRHEIGLPGDLWNVEADKGQLNQVVSNLIINADQAMPDGGNLRIWAENVNVVEDDLLPLKEGKYVKIVIEDQGPGISIEHLQKIFDPYYSTKEGGNGLGLSITYSIVRKHNGHIEVESKAGVGTTFIIYLPASGDGFREKSIQSGVEELESNSIDKNIESKTKVRKGKILVMDDEYIIRFTLSKTLENFGYEAATAEEGLEAINLYKSARESGEPFDVVVMDLTIVGGMGGKETIKELFKIDPEIKAIVVSGYTKDPIMTNYKKYGFSGALSKPHENFELDVILQNVINGN